MFFYQEIYPTKKKGPRNFHGGNTDHEWSPEHGPWEDGVTYAQVVFWDLFTNTIEASKILNIDSSFRSTLEGKLAELDPGLRVGSWGQLREWKYTKEVNNHPLLGGC